MINLYVASKVHSASEWLPTVSSWKDVAICSRWHTSSVLGTKLQKLWDETIYDDLKKCDALLLYCKDEDVLKGALVEVGAVWFQKKPIIIVGPAFHAVKTLYYSDRVYHVGSFEEAEILLKNLIYGI